MSDTLDRREVDCTSCYAHWMRAEEATAMKKGPFATSEVSFPGGFTMDVNDGVLLCLTVG